MKFFLILVILMGCSASHVTKPKVPEHAPENYRPVGMVKYLNEGLSYVREQRREDAFKEMSEACNGKYKVLEEGERPDNFTLSTYNPAVKSIDTYKSNYWYISYSCE
ncbi:hypothetical protein ACJVC5_15655 [Peredibacter sp. HCB2-198]|uniref:hypothetical protein n=1 Tax=Peredibacter sp. HCB2-198 TaxID=3383025 RepID=UPI0038B564C2